MSAYSNAYPLGDTYPHLFSDPSRHPVSGGHTDRFSLTRSGYDSSRHTDHFSHTRSGCDSDSDYSPASSDTSHHPVRGAHTGSDRYRHAAVSGPGLFLPAR